MKNIFKKSLVGILFISSFLILFGTLLPLNKVSAAPYSKTITTLANPNSNGVCRWNFTVSVDSDSLNFNPGSKMTISSNAGSVDCTDNKGNKVTGILIKSYWIKASVKFPGSQTAEKLIIDAPMTSNPGGYTSPSGQGSIVVDVPNEVGKDGSISIHADMEFKTTALSAQYLDVLTKFEVSPSTPPTIANPKVVSVSQNTVRLQAEVLGLGMENNTTPATMLVDGFCYYKGSDIPTCDDWSSGDPIGIFTNSVYPISNLTPNTTYNWYAYVKNSANREAHTNLSTFKTLPTSGVPTVTVRADPMTVISGNTSRITWTSENANYCYPPVGYESAGHSATGSFYTDKLYDTTTFTVKCVNNPDLDPDGVPIGGGSGSSYELPLVPCFISETKVDMADGTTKNIEEVKVGDVLKGEKTNNTVLGLHKSILDGKLYSLNGGRYFVTDAHPFKTTDGWKSMNPDETAKENIGITVTKLEVGDTLITDKGNVLLKTINSKEGKVNTKLYNFYLNGDHTYFADNYLVHNKMACDSGPTNKRLFKIFKKYPPQP
jgi:hypothetical protein